MEAKFIETKTGSPKHGTEKEGPKQGTDEASLSQGPESHVPQVSPGKVLLGFQKRASVQSLRSMLQPCVVQHPS